MAMGRVRSTSGVMISTLLIIIIIIISNLLLLSTSAVTELSLWPYHHVHVINELQGWKVLLVHCKSDSRDLGIQNLDPGNDFTWRFRPAFFVAATLFRCYVAPDDDHHISFDAWTNDVAKKYEYGRSISWVAKDDGIYIRIPGQYDQCLEQWEQGRVMENDHDDKKSLMT